MRIEGCRYSYYYLTKMSVYSLEKLNTLSLLNQSISTEMRAVPEAQYSKLYPCKHLEGRMNRVPPAQGDAFPPALPRLGNCKTHLSLN